MDAPAQVCDPKIFCRVNSLQILAMNDILANDWLSGFAGMQHLALLGFNSISQVRSHCCKVSRSFWRVLSFGCATLRYHLQIILRETENCPVGPLCRARREVGQKLSPKVPQI